MLTWIVFAECFFLVMHFASETWRLQWCAVPAAAHLLLFFCP